MFPVQKRSKSFLLFSLFTFIFLFSNGSYANNRCSEIFKRPHAPDIINYYLEQVRRDNLDPKDPKFIDPLEEIARVNTWSGTRDAPLMIKDTLRGTTAVIANQLMAADKGTVIRAGVGNFISLRFNHEWNGHDMSTHLGITTDSLLVSSLENSSHVVPDTANAVLFFFHGGGTKTTGHHVGANITNFFNQFKVPVISFDKPYHGYGPRSNNLTAREYIEYIIDLRWEMVPENVPVGLTGHSWGGWLTDHIMRLSEDPELGPKIKKAFSFVAPLSPPIDNAPGKSIKEKSLAEERILKDEAVISRILESEVDLNIELLKGGKTSALSGLMAGAMMAQTNWQMPKDNGANLIPAMYIMGERDALYVGREDIFKKYVVDLANTETHIIDERPTFRGDGLEGIGHMIFDHYRKGTEIVKEGDKKAKPQQETFFLIKEFMEKQIGKELRVEVEVDPKGNSISNRHPLLSPYPKGTVGLALNILQEWYNNLAFRKFATQYHYLIRESNGDAVGRLDAVAKALTTEARQLENELKDLQKKEPESERLSSLRVDLNLKRQRITQIRDKQRSVYVPTNSPLTDFAQENVAKRAALKNQKNANFSAKKKLVSELNQVRARRTQLQNKHESSINNKMDELSENHPEVAAAFQAHEKAAEDMIELQIQMDKINNDLIQKMIDNGRYLINPPESAIAVYKALDAAYGLFNATERAWRAEIEHAIGRGDIGEAEAKVFIELYGSHEAFLKNKPTADSLIGRSELLQDQIEAIELENSTIKVQENSLLEAYINEVTPELFSVRSTTLANEMNRPLEEVIQHMGHIAAGWKVWSDIWGERPPEQATSLY